MLTNHQKELQAKDKIIEELRESVQKRYEFPTARIDNQKINTLETKLEKVRNLLADNEIARLKSLFRQGQI